MNKTENSISKTKKSENKQPVSNPMTKQLNSLQKSPAKNLKTVKQNDTLIEKVSNPIETTNIVAKINNFNTNKTSNKMYGGYMNAASNRIIDYSDIVYSLNSIFSDKIGIQELFARVNNLFNEKLLSTYTAFGIYHEKSKCLNMKLFNSMGSTYTSKIFLSDDENPVIECFNKNIPLIKENNKFLNMPYLNDS